MAVMSIEEGSPALHAPFLSTEGRALTLCWALRRHLRSLPQRALKDGGGSQPSVTYVCAHMHLSLGVPGETGKDSEGLSPDGEGGELEEAPKREEVWPQKSEE